MLHSVFFHIPVDQTMANNSSPNKVWSQILFHAIFFKFFVIKLFDAIIII